jgi:hypothetical protein
MVDFGPVGSIRFKSFERTHTFAIERARKQPIRSQQRRQIKIRLVLRNRVVKLRSASLKTVKNSVELDLTTPEAHGVKLALPPRRGELT